MKTWLRRGNGNWSVTVSGKACTRTRSNYGKSGSGPVMKEGLVIAIEPMIDIGKKKGYTDDDGWTVCTKDGKPSVHFEHDVCVKKGKADVLSNYAKIEEAKKQNGNLFANY